MDLRPIGVTDSGSGGLTVVRELLRLLPGEDIIYFSDAGNFPYGSRSRREVFGLVCEVLRFLQEQDVKLTAIACNTMSTVLDELVSQTQRPLIGPIEPIARRIAQDRLERVGVIATPLTIASGTYERALAEHAPDTAVFSHASHHLAPLVQTDTANTEAIDAEIRAVVSPLVEQGIADVILGCTHYPIVFERFTACFPTIRFIDPAHEQAKTIRKLLTEADALTDRRRGSLTICTSGDPAADRDVCERLGIFEQTTPRFLKR